MKTFIKTAVFTVIAAALLVGPVVQAETNRSETGYAPGYGEPVKKVETRAEIKADANGKLEVPFGLQPSIDAKVRAELEAALKLENARCAKLGERERRECYAQSEENFQTGLRKAFNYTQATIDAKKTIDQRDLDMKAMLDAKKKTGEGFGKTGETKSDETKKDDSRDIKPTPRTETPSTFQTIYTNYFKRVVANLMAINERIAALANRVDSRLEKLKEQGVDVSVSSKLIASAREELRLGKASIEAASKAFESEYKKPIPGVTVTNPDTGVTITTGDVEYRACIEEGGKLDENYKDRCWIDKHVYTNPTAVELVGLMAAQIRNEQTSFPNTFKYIREAKAHFKAAHKYVAEAISNIKPGQNDDVKPTGVIKSEVNSEVKTD